MFSIFNDFFFWDGVHAVRRTRSGFAHICAKCQRVKMPSAGNAQLSKVLPSKPGEGQNIALHALHTAMNCFFYLPGTFNLIPPPHPQPSSSVFKHSTLCILNCWSDFYLKRKERKFNWYIISLWRVKVAVLLCVSASLADNSSSCTSEGKRKRPSEERLNRGRSAGSPHLFENAFGGVGNTTGCWLLLIWLWKAA